MADDLKEAPAPEEESAGVELEPELWDWARAAGVSREDLLRALRLPPPR